MSYGRHRLPREPRWHDRPRAWLAAALHWLHRDWYEEGEELTDDHGNHIGGDLPDYEYDREPRVIRTAKVSGVYLPLSGDHVNWTVNCAFTKETWMRLGGRASRECQPAPVTHWQGTSGRKRRPQTSDRPPETPRPGGYNPTVEEWHGPTTGPGYRQNVPRPRGARRWPASEATMPVLPPATEARWPSTVNDLSGSHGPGHLSMWDLAYVRSPWPPRPDDTVIISGPRVCAGRIALLAGGW